MNVVDHALRLAGWGKPVFPCRADKRPATPRGFKNATTDPEQVRSMWRRWPGPLIGMPTGAASGVDALDVDPRHGGDAWLLGNAYRIPATRMHRTGSGGLHVLFVAHDAVRCTIGLIAPGIDTRAAGGYFIYWPAQGLPVERVQVAAWPAWLLTAMQKPREQPTRTGLAEPALNPDASAHRIALRVLDRLAKARDGQRHITLRKSAYVIGGLLSHLPFGEAEAAARLVRAVEAAGAVDLVSAAKTAAWALDRGKTKPIDMERSR